MSLLLCSEFQANKTHEDTRQDWQQHVQVQVLRDAIQCCQYSGEAHEEVFGAQEECLVTDELIVHISRLLLLVNE